MGGRSTPTPTGSQASGKGNDKKGSEAVGGGVAGNECPASLHVSVTGPAAGIVQGSWLEVQLDNTSTPPRVVLTDSVSGQIVGALAGVPNLALLLRCLADGVAYRAYVAAVQGGRVDVTLARQD